MDGAGLRRPRRPSRRSRPRSPGSRSCACRRSRNGSRPTSAEGATARWSASSRRSRASSRCGSACGSCSCSRCTGPAGRRTRWRRSNAPATASPDELGVDPSPDLRRLHERILRQDPDLDLEGEPLRGYRLLEQVGEGAFGVVYRAIQPQVGREVAIKAVHPELANHPDFVRRFEHEAQIVARLEHPHIVPLYDYWREPDAAYLVMRFLRGGSVEDLLEAGPLDPARAVVDHGPDRVGALRRRTGRASSIATSSPGNVLLDEEGNAYLTDFGVALDAGSPERTTGTMMRGTPAYLSPEQIRLEPASPRSDVYALGIVAVRDADGRASVPRDLAHGAARPPRSRCDPIGPRRFAGPARRRSTR